MALASFVQMVLALVGAQWVAQASAHGKLTSPASRNHIDGNAGCSHCLNGGGPCGSGKFLDYYAGTQATWTAGSIVPITIRVTAHHMGHYEFRICDQVLDSSVSNPDACLNKWVMQRASPEEAGFMDCQPGDERPACVPVDPKHPERWYLPPSAEISGTHTIYFKVPADLQCTECTLQWHWWSANSCEPAGDYGCFKQILQSNGYWVGSKGAWWTAFGGSCSGPDGPNGHFGCGEQFWNCADITVLPQSGVPVPTPAPVPVPSTTSVPVTTPAPTPVPTPSPTPMPAPMPASCAACAGKNYQSPCVWTDGECYPVGREMCMGTEGTTWCGESTETTTAVPPTTRSTTMSMTTTTTTVLEGHFKPVSDGEGRACRGATASDNSANHYTLEAGVASIDDCKDRCVATCGCQGIEYNAGSGRCEVWTRPGGILASVAVNGYVCLSYNGLATCTTSTTTTMAGPFEAVDGGEGRACRGASASDNSAAYYSIEADVVSLEDCKARCTASAACKGIEYNPTSRRCEVWKRSIDASSAAPGYSCYTFIASGACRVRFASSGATPENCKRTCDILEQGTWPCSSDGPCDCSAGAMLIMRARRTQLRGRFRSLDVGVGFIQQNSSTTPVHLLLNEDAASASESCTL